MATLYDPDIRHKHVLEAQRKPELIVHLDRYESTLLLYLAGELQPDDCSLKHIREANDKFNNTIHKKVIMALFISGATVEEICQITGLQRQTVHLFEKLFFDTSVFSSRLDYLSYIELEVQDDDFRDYFIHAFRMGPQYIKWDLGDKSIDLDETFIAKDIMQSTYMYGKSAMLKQQDVTIIKHWTTITHQYIRLIKDLDVDVRNPLEALMFKLRIDNESKSIDEFAPESIV